MDRGDPLTVLRQLGAVFEHYNDVHPHKALKMLSPRMFRLRNVQFKYYRVSGEIGAAA